MAVSEQTVQVRVLRSRLLELGLYSSLVTTATMLAWWYWQRQTIELFLSAMPEMASMPILARLLLQKPIVLTFALAELILGFALLLAVVPIGWWLKSNQIDHPEISPVAWLARSISGTLSPAEDSLPDASAIPHAEAAPATGAENPAQAAAQPPVAGAATAAQAGAEAAPPSPGQTPQPQQPAANPAQPPVPGQPGVTPPAPQQPQPAQQPQSTQPSQPTPATETPPVQEQPGLLQSLEVPPEEEESLGDLTDVSDILASFIDEDLVDPMLADLSASLEDVEIATLVATSGRLARELRSARMGRTVAEPALRPGKRMREPSVAVWNGR